jgi:hypothetical protein
MTLAEMANVAVFMVSRSWGYELANAGDLTPFARSSPG